jgi:O-antigen ligase
MLSLAWSDDLVSTFRQIGIFAEAVVAYWVAVNVFAPLPASVSFRYLGLFLVLLLLGSILSLAQVPGFGPPTYGLQEGSPDHVAYLAAYYSRLGHPFYGLHNDFASVLSLFTFPFLAWAVVRRSGAYFVLSVCTLAAVVLTQSRGVIAATVLGGVVFLAAERRRLLRWLPGVAFGSAVVLSIGYFYYQINETVQTYLADRLQFTTIQVRRDILSAALERLSDAPVFGYGGGVVPGGDPVLAEGVHNTYLQQMLYYGIPLGLVATAALWILATLLLRWPARSKAVTLTAVAMGVSMLVQLVQFLGETSFEATLPKTALYLFVGLCVVTLQNLNRDAGSSQPAPMTPRMTPTT